MIVYMNPYSLLEKSAIYNLVGKVLKRNHLFLDLYIKNLIYSQDSDKILDVGCGTGRYASLFKGVFYGVDPNQDYIDYANRHYPDGKFKVMSGEKLEFSTNYFDYVFNVGVLHHIADETVVEVINEMKRVCKQGGEIFIIEAVYPPITNLLGYLLFKLDRGKYTRTLSRLKEMLIPEGFTLIQDGIKGTNPYRLDVFHFKK